MWPLLLAARPGEQRTIALRILDRLRIPATWVSRRSRTTRLQLWDESSEVVRWQCLLNGNVLLHGHWPAQQRLRWNRADECDDHGGVTGPRAEGSSRAATPR